MPLLMVAATLSGCGIGSSVSGPLDRNLDKAPIEAYILALPAFAFHEESASDFRMRVMSSKSIRRGGTENPDFLHCEGDGSYPVREFTLDRASHTLTIKSLPGEGPTSGNTVAMKRVAGKWIKVSPSN